MQNKATKKKNAAGPQLPELHVKKNRGGSRTCYATFNGRKVWFGRADDPETQTKFDVHLAAWDSPVAAGSWEYRRTGGTAAIRM